MKKLLKTTRKTVLLSTASLFTLAATASVYQSTDSTSEAAYLIQGANKATMTSIVNKVGGDILHDFSVIPAISAELSQEQVEQINKMNPLLRITSKEGEKTETAGFVWGSKKGKTGERIAGFVWGSKKGKTGERIAGFVWGIKKGKTGERIAGFVWGSKKGKTGERIV